jgi:hypothetical protein
VVSTVVLATGVDASVWEYKPKRPLLLDKPVISIRVDTTD